MVLMCCRFLCCSFMFMVVVSFVFKMIICMMRCVFQRVMMMAENSLVSEFSMQPAYKSFVKVYDINSQNNYVQCIFHLKFDMKFLINKDTKVRKK